MARMHARRRGKSGSVRPISKLPPAWVKMTPEEVESLVVEYYKQGYKPSMIGTILRDSHGVPLVKQITGKSIKQILKENGLYTGIPEDLENLLAKVMRMRKHLERFKSDRANVHRLQLIESKVRRLIKYYKRIGELPPEWVPPIGEVA
ncbi:MAG: 30S ribosomal protein S15 [Candidatus Terraquivivens tikiterensis]|uniref:Small ribosomal subunit protein uS15 n=1 Tax=Candidatus Terraquivivens tikiterensis TaxID=1980982 RepID=A0A2R7Y1H5_9ARCH|nr:MAG: 30S ribosomal protein S15 [Candidatus Terraquivivens tikiterensis]